MFINKHLKSALLVSLSILITACGGGGGETPDTSNTTTSTKTTTSTSTPPPTSTTTSTTLTWTMPTTKVDSGSLAPGEIGGTRIYSGTTADSLSLIHDVSYTNPTPTQYTVESLSTDTTYYFAIRVYDIYGGESTYSNTVVRNL